MNNRWGMPEGYNVTPTREVKAQPTIGPTVVVDKTAVQAANKTVQVLETVVNDLRVENEKLKRENSTLNGTTRNLEATIRDLEGKLTSATTRTDAYKTDTFGTTYGHLQPVGVVRSNPTDIYAMAKPVQSLVERVTQATTIAPSYTAPVNPMAVFVEFLEELDIFQEYVQVTTDEDISFDLLCNQYDPSDWISEVCTDDDGDLLEEWEEASELWQAICEEDDLNSKEAYIE